jgi:hypothetical protein
MRILGGVQAPAGRHGRELRDMPALLTMLLRELDRRQVRYGLESMCIGGGQGLSGLLERVGP